MKRGEAARHRCVAAAVRLAFGGALVVTLAGRAHASDPHIGFRARAAAGDRLGVSERLDANAANFTQVLLPKTPSLGFQVRLAPPIVGEPTADGAGGVLVAHGRDRISALDASGRSLWSVRVPGELASGAIPFGAERYLLVARDGRLFELSSAGSVTERPTLPWNDIDARVLYAPAADGGTILAAGARLARIGPAGARGFLTRLRSPARAVFDWRGATLAVATDGTLFSRGTAGDVMTLGNFGAPVAAALLLGDRILALTQHELLSIELASGRANVVWAEPALELRDFASAGGRLRVVAGRALVIELDGSGHELGRVALGAGETSPEITSLVSDAAGASLAVTTGAPLALIAADGDVSSIAGTGCPDAVRVTPVAQGRLIAACRSGLVRGVSDKAR